MAARRRPREDDQGSDDEYAPDGTCNLFVFSLLSLLCRCPHWRFLSFVVIVITDNDDAIHLDTNVTVDRGSSVRRGRRGDGVPAVIVQRAFVPVYLSNRSVKDQNIESRSLHTFFLLPPLGALNWNSCISLAPLFPSSRLQSRKQHGTVSTCLRRCRYNIVSLGSPSSKRCVGTTLSCVISARHIWFKLQLEIYISLHYIIR